MPVYERGTLAQVTADVDGKLRIAEQKLARLTRISGDYIPQREVDDTKTEIESLRQQKRVLEPKNVERMELKAPVSGVISVANVRAGQVVNARDTLFEIVDPARLWVEAIGMDRHDDEGIADAYAIDGQGHRFKLAYIGRAPALRQQSLPLLFKLDEAHDSISIGATVKVFAQRKASRARHRAAGSGGGAQRERPAAGVDQGLRRALRPGPRANRAARRRTRARARGADRRHARRRRRRRIHQSGSLRAPQCSTPSFAAVWQTGSSFSWGRRPSCFTA